MQVKAAKEQAALQLEATVQAESRAQVNISIAYICLI